MDAEIKNINAKRTKFSLSKLKGDRVIWLIVVIFAMISIAVVYSSTSSLAYRNHNTPFSYMFSQSISYIIGFALLLICYRIPLGWYRKLSYILLALSGILLFIPIIKHNLRSFSLFGMSVQPSEFAKISVVLYLARILETSDFKTFKEYALKILLPVGAICVLCIYGSISATMIICFITLIILITSEIKWKHILYTILIAIGALGILISIHAIFGTFKRFDTFIPRIERFFNKNDNNMSAAEIEEAKNKNFQSKQAREAIQLGKIFGRGPGNSIKRETLPNGYDDYIYAIIVEEYGLVGGIVVILLYIWLFNRCIIIARLCKREFSATVVLGFALLIILQAFMHIFVNIGILPVTGQTLPMISKGKSSLMVLSCAIGIILSVNRTIVITENKRKEREEIEREQMKNIERT